eukprot:s2083_g10.t1
MRRQHASPRLLMSHRSLVENWSGPPQDVGLAKLAVFFTTRRADYRSAMRSDGVHALLAGRENRTASMPLHHQRKLTANSCPTVGQLRSSKECYILLQMLQYLQYECFQCYLDCLAQKGLLAMGSIALRLVEAGLDSDSKHQMHECGSTIHDSPVTSD